MSWLWWAAGAVVALLLFLAPVLGYAVQPWYPWWVSGGNGGPGVVGLPPIDIGGGGGVPVPVPASAPGPSPDGSLLMQVIQPYLAGPTPYLFGGCSVRGIDCSCFTQNVMARLGVSLPRTAQAQWNATVRTNSPQVGDLVFFQHTYDSPDTVTHVGIVVGDGWMVSAAEPAVGRQRLDSPFWRAHLAGFGRVRFSPPNQA